jgi:hypothetical protein
MPDMCVYWKGRLLNCKRKHTRYRLTKNKVQD